MKLKIVSDGTLEGTNVVDSTTGERVEGVNMITYNVGVDDTTTCAHITIANVEIELKDVQSSVVEKDIHMTTESTTVKKVSISSDGSAVDTKIIDSATNKQMAAVQDVWFLASETGGVGMTIDKIKFELAEQNKPLWQTIVEKLFPRR